MRPIYERVLIKPIKKETTTSGGIMLPTEAVKRPNIGEVIACGEGSSHNEMKVKPGDRVLCNRHAGAELKLGGEIHYMLMVNDIMAIIDDDDDLDLEEFE